MTTSERPTATGLRVVAITPTGVLSGAERVLIRHAKCGIELGDHWTILSPEGPTGRRVADAGIGWIEIPELKLGAGPRPVAAAGLALNNLRAAATVRRAVADADVIVANSVLCLPLLRLLRPAAPVTWLVHDVITRTDLAALARWSAPAVDHSIPVSEAAAVLSNELGIETTVVRNGIEPRPVLEARRALPPIVGLNAVLTEWKGQHVLLEALASIPPPTVVELLGGALPKDGPYEERLRERADRPDLRGRVRFVGHRKDPDTIMRRWTIAVSASVEPEAGPLSVLEAMNLGVAVIVTDHGGAPEIVEGVGVIVPPDDPAALAEAVVELLGDPQRRHHLAIAARDRVITTLTRRELEPAFRAVLEQTARRGRRR